MLQKYKDKKDQGFTIIEVLIVLAIAGLIILIVFLAVPALQRNSRNTQRRNDVSALLGAVQEYVNNNGGSLPASGNAATVYNNAAPGYYENVSNFSIDGSALTINPATDPDDALNSVRVVTGAQCANATSVDTNPGNQRQYVVQFWVETSGTPQEQCQQS